MVSATWQLTSNPRFLLQLPAAPQPADGQTAECHVPLCHVVMCHVSLAANFVITTMSGEPLLMLQERFRWMNYEYDLFRVDPRTHAAIPVCKIVRTWTLFAITDVYEISLFGPGIHGACPVQCAGRWPNKFTLHTNGAVSAQVSKRISTTPFRVQCPSNALPCPSVPFRALPCASKTLHDPP